ncbi:hypothetical protein [Propionivibrio sp.]|uniref:hypothetical protein n=1 Tax=Propionivibrio sp. TaxID=2212460 RepID=UPI003BF0C70F
MQATAKPNCQSLFAVLSFGVMVLTSGCTQLPDGPIEWSAIGNESHTLIRIEPAPSHEFRFNNQGHVAASFIQPNGSVVAPLLYWRVEGKLLIISEQPGGSPLMTLADPSAKDGDIFATESSGTKAKFKYRRSL